MLGYCVHVISRVCLYLLIYTADESHISHFVPDYGHSLSLHWLKINERIECKLLSLTYKVLTTSQPDYLHNLISVQSTGRTCSSSLVTLARPPVIFLITNHQPLFHICITLPVESAPFFIPSTSFCSLSSGFTSSCAYYLITVTTFALITYHCLYLPLQT